MAIHRWRRRVEKALGALAQTIRPQTGDGATSTSRVKSNRYSWALELQCQHPPRQSGFEMTSKPTLREPVHWPRMLLDLIGHIENERKQCHANNHTIIALAEYR